MKSIFLIGFMGSGKTSVAKALADKLASKVLDTDTLIEETYEMKIPEIFAQYGEGTFRDYESNILKQAPIKDAIVSTGGGIIERQENREWIKEHGISVYLDTSWEEIVDRLQHDESRPLWNNDQLDKRKLLEKRLPKYIETAVIVVKTDQKTPEQIAGEIMQLLTNKD